MIQKYKTWLKRKRLLRQLQSENFYEVVKAIYTILKDSKLYEGLNNRVVHKRNHPWTIDRERAYTIIQVLVYLEHKDLKFPFYSADGKGPSVVHAMMKAIGAFRCFENLTYNDFVKFYNRPGLVKNGAPNYAITLPEDKVVLMGSRFAPYGPEVTDQLIRRFNPENFHDLVSAIYEVLSEVELNAFPKGFNMGQHEGEIDWDRSRERVYVVFPLLQFLKYHTKTFSFTRESKSDQETIIDAMLLAIKRFECFKPYTHDDLLEMYKHRLKQGIAALNIWGENLPKDLGIFVHKPE
jgi:hypothetical protein